MGPSVQIYAMICFVINSLTTYNNNNVQQQQRTTYNAQQRKATYNNVQQRASTYNVQQQQQQQQTVQYTTSPPPHRSVVSYDGKICAHCRVLQISGEYRCGINSLHPPQLWDLYFKFWPSGVYFGPHPQCRNDLNNIVICQSILKVSCSRFPAISDQDQHHELLCRITRHT